MDDMGAYNWAGSDTGNGGGVPASYTSGFFQSVAALGTGYLGRRLDIDLQNRITGSQPAVNVSGSGPRQSMAGSGAPGTQAVIIPGVGSISIVPLVLLAGAAFLAFGA